MDTLPVTNRTIFKKKVAKLRQQNKIPCELYGNNIINKHLTIDKKDWIKIWNNNKENKIINLITGDGQNIQALIHNIQINPLTNEILSIDFLQIQTDKPIKVKVPIEFVGEAPAIKKGNIIIKTLNELEIESLPENIPESIKVDLSNLQEENQNINISDINLPSTIKIFVPHSTILAIVKHSGSNIELEQKPAAEPTTVESEPNLTTNDKQPTHQNNN
ncbi:MAG: 50S ribosomal protein L25 [Minisyncoccia bacterium]